MAQIITLLLFFLDGIISLFVLGGPNDQDATALGVPVIILALEESSKTPPPHQGKEEDRQPNQMALSNEDSQ